MKPFLYLFLIAGANAQVINGVSNGSLNSRATPVSSIASPVLANNTSDPQLFVYNGSFHNCASQIVNVLVIGDSIAYGWGANIPNTGGWAGRLASNLQKICPSHGTGIIPAYMPQWNQSVVDTNLNAQNGWSMTNSVGPYQSGSSPFGTLYQGGPGTNPATLSSQQGDTAVVYYATYVDTGSGFGVSIDGGPATTYGASTSSTYTAAKAVVPIPGGLGAHTVTITPPPTGHIYLYGAELTIGNVGISVHNTGRPGARTDAFGSAPESQNAFWPQIGGGIQLVIDSLGVNDLFAWNPSNFQTYQQNMIANWQALSSPSPSILILDQNHIQNENGNNKFQEQRIELALNTAYSSVADRWGLWTNANALGLQFDAWHPNDKGYEDITAMLSTQLTDGSFESSTYPSNPTLQSLTVTGAANAVHLGSSGGTPGMAVGAALGKGAGSGLSITGSDNNGYIVFNTGSTNVTNGTMGTIIFNQPWVNTSTSVVACVLQPANATSVLASTNVYISGVTTTLFTVTANFPLNESSSYAYFYHCGN